MQVLSTVLVCLLLHSVTTFSQDDFTLVKKEGNIFIYERWGTFPNTNPPVDAREVKSEFYFNNSIEEAVRLLQDEKRIKRWQSHVTEFKVYQNDDTLSWVEYSYHDIPWPVSDQDHMLRYAIQKDVEGHMFITFESIVDNVRAPVKKGVSRMELTGSWTFERIAHDKVKATYRILSMPGGIPRFITDPIIRNNMMSTIQKFIGLMEPQKKK